MVLRIEMIFQYTEQNSGQHKKKKGKNKKIIKASCQGDISHFHNKMVY